MADIELVIKVPEEEYRQFIKDQKEKYDLVMITADIITNGSPLPKGHGDLIDKNELIEMYKRDCGRKIYADNFIFDIENNTTTIIVADTNRK